MAIFSKNFIKFSLVAIFIASSFLISAESKASAYDNNYPKLANYYLGWDLNEQIISDLAKWDLVIISNAAYSRYPSVVKELKSQNPNIVVLVYVVAQEALTISSQVEDGIFFKEILETVTANDWWLYKADGSKLSTWPNANWVNLTPYGKTVNGENFTTWLARRSAERYLINGEFDGIFYDNVFDNVTWASKEFDINRDGQIDVESTVNEQWKAGVVNLLEKTRSFAPGKIIIANTNTNLYNSKMNGRLLEHFPKTQEGGWGENLKRYIENGIKDSPKIFILNSNNNNLDDQFADLQKVRFTFTSSLLGNGFYSYTIGDQTHASTWWYDEYSVNLGSPLGGAKNTADASSPTKAGVYKRDFANGTVFVNSTTANQTINLGADYEKIKGNQAPEVNNGAIIRKLTLAPNDGIVLRRKVSDKDIINSVFQNGSFVKPFKLDGTDLDRNGFFIFDKQEQGNKMIARLDLEGDGLVEKVLADDNKIVIYNNDGTLRSSFKPYGEKYNLGINFDIGDVDNDGKNEIVTGTMKGGEPLVKIFTNEGKEKNKGFYVYDKKFKGGVNIALGNLNGSGKKDIIVGAGHNGGALVRIYNGEGKLVSGGFYAYDKKFRGGVYVASGDLNGDGKDEIITGAGFGGSPHVRIFDSKAKLLNKGFFAFDKNSRQGVKVFSTDLDGDGIDEILAANPNPF